MEEIKMYKSFDGEIFDTLEECLEHEEREYPSKDDLKGLRLFDSNLNEIVSDGTLSYDELYDKLMWFTIKLTENYEASVNCIARILECGPYGYPNNLAAGDVYSWKREIGWYNYSAEFREMKDNLEIIYGSML